MSQSWADKKREKILQRIQDFRLLDDDFMTKCFENNIECTELILRIIMDKPDLQVNEARTQYTIKNLQGRSVRLDVDATDKEERKYNIEIQRADSGAGSKRARYNSSLIDANVLLPGDNPDDLPETYVIFITENDVIGKNKPLYHINRWIEETGEIFKDGSHIIYVNGACKDDTPLGWLMKDFSCTNPSDMHYRILADRVRYFKEDKEGIQAMCRAVEELCNQEKRETMIDVAKRMLAAGKYALEEIANISGLPIEEVKKLIADTKL